MLETSVTLDVWKMTVQEFDRTIASLTDDVDRLTGYSERLNGLRERLEDRNAALTAERDALQSATRKVVDAGKMRVNSVLDASGHMQDALADPTIVALRRE